jgi:hypothetical protein
MRLATLLIAFCLVGCAAKPVVMSIAPQGAGPVNGIPLRVKTDQIVQVWQYDPDQGYVLVAAAHQSLADPHRLFVVDVSTYPFASPGLHLTENPDNTLKSIEVSSTENQSGALAEVATGITSVTSANTTRATACQTAIGGALTADQAVATAQASLDQVPPTASDALKTAYRNVIASAQTAAMGAHARAAKCE